MAITSRKFPRFIVDKPANAADFFLTFGGAANAASFSFADIADRASKNAAFIQAQVKDVEASKAFSEGAGLLPNPNVSLQLGHLRSGGSQGVTAEAALLQTIPFPGKRGAQKYLGEMEQKIAEVALEEAKLVIQHEATLLAIQWLVIDKEAEHLLERKRRFNLVHTYLLNHPQASPSQKIEKDLIESQIQLLEKSFVTVDEEKKTLESRLRLYAQIEGDFAIKEEWLVPQKALEFALDSQRSIEGNFQKKRKQLEVEKAQGQLTRSKVEKLPDIGVGIGYRVENVVPSNHFYYGTLNLSIPLFDRGQYSVPEAQAKLDAQRARLEHIRRRAAQELEESLIQLRAASQIAASFPVSKAEAVEAKFDLSEQEFKKGRITTSILLQTDAQLHEILGTTYDAQLLLAQRLSKVFLLKGTPLKLR